MSTLAAVQMNSGGDLAANLDCASNLLQRCAKAGAGLAVLPENFSGMPENMASRRSVAEADGSGPLQEFISSEAKRLRLWIVGGTIPVRSTDPDRPFSSSYVFDHDGICVGRYDKAHLFDVKIPGSDEAYQESAFTQPGTAALVVESPWGRLGVAVCYDLRFPEQFRQMSSTGLDVVAVPSAFTVPTGQAHWDTLLRARAVENLCYVVAAAQTGCHPGNRETYGHSMIIGPWGQVLGDAGSSEGVITAAFDRAGIDELRQRFPVLAHRSEMEHE